MFRRVRLHLIGCIVGVLAAVLLAAGTAVFLLLSHQLDAAVDAQLRAAMMRTGVLGMVLQPPEAPPPAYAPPGNVAPDALGSATYVPGLSVQQIVAAAPVKADVVAPATQLDPNSVFLNEWLEGGAEKQRGGVPPGLPDRHAAIAARPGRDDLRTVSLNGLRYRLLTRALRVPADQPRLIQQAGISLAERDRQQRIVLLALAGGGVLGLALTAAGSLLLTGRALAPLQLAFERQRRFVADASHELRTPLALIRLETEDAADRLNARPALRPLLRQVDRAARLVDDLLTLARLEGGTQPPEPEPVHVRTLLEEAATAARRLAAPGVTVTSVSAGDLWLRGDRDQLARVLLIVVDNACRVTPPGGRIALSAERCRGMVALCVADSGPGVPAAHLPRLFERFYRVDGSRARTGGGGTGLGLAIAREILAVHGGAIALASPPGAGVRVSIRLPATTVPAAVEDAV